MLKVEKDMGKDEKGKNSEFALSELDRMSSELGLPEELKEKVGIMYQKAVEKGLVKGRRVETVLGTLIYALSREYGSPRLMSEICNIAGVDKREFGRNYRYIASKLNIRVIPSTAIAYVPRCATLLKMDDKVQTRANKYLRALRANRGFSGKGPIGLAAATLYIAAIMNNNTISQRGVAEAIGVTEVTVRNRCADIAKALEIEDEVNTRIKEIGAIQKEQNQAAKLKY